MKFTMQKVSCLMAICLFTSPLFSTFHDYYEETCTQSVQRSQRLAQKSYDILKTEFENQRITVSSTGVNATKNYLARTRELFCKEAGYAALSRTPGCDDWGVSNDCEILRSSDHKKKRHCHDKEDSIRELVQSLFNIVDNDFTSNRLQIADASLSQESIANDMKSDLCRAANTNLQNPNACPKMNNLRCMSPASKATVALGTIMVSTLTYLLVLN